MLNSLGKLLFLEMLWHIDLVMVDWIPDFTGRKHFMILPLVSAVFSVPSLLWTMALAIVPWLIYISLFGMLNTDYLSYTGAGRLYIFLLLAQIVLYKLWAAFAAMAKKKPRGRRNTSDSLR